MEEANAQKKWNGPERRLSRNGMDQLEIEIHNEKVRVWVDGASQFLNNDRNQVALTELVIKALNKWVEVNRRRLLERFGFYALGAMVLTLLAMLGWKGWGGR